MSTHMNRTSRGCKQPQPELIRECSIALVVSSRTRARWLSTRQALSVSIPSHVDSLGALSGDIGNSDAVGRDRSVCFDPVCWSRVLEAIIFIPEHLFGAR